MVEYADLLRRGVDALSSSPREGGVLLGWFAAARAWLPVATGALSDRVGFRRSLLASFALYVVAYSMLAALPTRPASVDARTAAALAPSTRPHSLRHSSWR